MDVSPCLVGAITHVPIAVGTVAFPELVDLVNKLPARGICVRQGSSCTCGIPTYCGNPQWSFAADTLLPGTLAAIISDALLERCRTDSAHIPIVPPRDVSRALDFCIAFDPYVIHDRKAQAPAQC